MLQNLNKKQKIIIIIIIFLVLLIGIGIYLGLEYKKQKNISLDLTQLDTKIYDIGDYSQISMIDIDEYYLKEKLQVDTDEIEEFIGKIPLVNIKSSMYLVIKSKSDNANYILRKVQKYGYELENEWKEYLAEQYYIVKDRKIGKIGNYVYIIVSYDTDDILKAITSN